MRRSAMSATSASAMASKSSHRAGPWPWKLPPETARNSPASVRKISGLSVAALMAVLNRSRTNASAIEDRAQHLRRAAQAVGVLHAARRGVDQPAAAHQFEQSGGDLALAGLPAGFLEVRGRTRR